MRLLMVDCSRLVDPVTTNLRNMNALAKVFRYRSAIFWITSYSRVIAIND